MRQLTCFLTLAALLATALAQAEDAYRDDFDTVTGWEPQLSWQSNPSQQATLTTRDGVATFTAPEPGLGLKWRLTLQDPVDIDLTPWLVIRYRATNYRPTVDYLLWLSDGNRGDGVPLIVGDLVRADGQWHTQAVQLLERKVVSPLSALALQCAATGAGNASLEVDYLAVTDTPPADAEGFTVEAAPRQQWPVELTTPGAWKAQPSWLANYSPGSTVTAGTNGLVFTVPEGTRGAKWSYELPQPLTAASWVAMRYRARNLQLYGDYALYVASEGGGQAPQEQYLIRQTELIPDGEWHVAVARLAIPTIRTLAMQVQALRANAALEVGDLRFLDGKPVLKLADTFEATPGWPADMLPWRCVALPPGNLKGEDLARRLGFQDFIAAGKITAGGIPFEVRDGTDAAMVTPLKGEASLNLPLQGRAAEAYLLLAAQFPVVDEPSYPGAGGVIRQVHRLVARIAYADGSSEEQFPFAPGSSQHAVSRGLRTYCLALQPKPLKQLSLVDRMDRGAFGLVALTLSAKPGPATEATRLAPAVVPPAVKPVAARAAGMRLSGTTLSVDAWTVSMALDLSRGLRLASFTDHSGVKQPTRLRPGPLFRLLTEEKELTSEQFTVQGTSLEEQGGARAYRLDLVCREVTPEAKVTVWVDCADPREVGLRARVQLGGRDPLKTRLIFPELCDLRFGDVEDTWVWCPRRGDVITAELVSLREAYSGAGNPLQIVGAFDPRQGAGVYLLTQDQDAVSRYYQVQKSGSGARLAVEYSPTGEAPLPRTVVGCSQGDWHQQLARYQEWAATWYKPAAPRKSWFREVFSFRQHFLHFGLPVKSGMFDEAGKTLRLKEVLAADDKVFGGLDYLHLFDWGWDPVHGRCGDYTPWEYLGGVDNFRRAVAGVQDRKVPVGLYIEGILVDPESSLGKAHGQQWQLLDAQGKPYTYFAPSYNMCPHVKAWQDYLSDTYRRVQGETGAKGFYIDEYGFSDPGHWCYNPAHGHPVPATPVLGERGMLRQIREKLGPEAAIYTEESPTDVNSQYQDGSFTYNISSVPDAWSPTHVNLYRFAYPSFKTIEIITCDHPLGTNVEAVKRILFNGEAIWIEGIWDKWFSAEVRAQIALNRKVMRENRQCFAGDHPQPLVPTLLCGIYANQFSERADLLGKTCWTVYNTNYRTVRGEVLAVDHAPGCQYLDELTGKPLKVRVQGKKAYLTLDLAPRDVVVVSRGLYVK